MQIIQNWLKGKRDFTVGAMLYQRFGKNEQLKILLDKGPTDFNQKELATELTKIAQAGLKKTPPPINKEVAEMPVSDNQILEAIRNEWMPLFAKMNLLRHELDKYDDRNDWEAVAWRQPRAKEIKELEKKCMAIWAKRDYYLKHGALPFQSEKKIDIPADPIQAANLINNIKKYIRRNRQEMNKPGANAKFAQRYQEYKSKYREVTGEDYEEKN